MHCTEDNKNDWRAEWGYQALFSCCTSKKAGVAILFNNNFTFQISKTYSDPEGRFIICDLTLNKNQLTLTNIYAPNNDDSNFFTSVFSHLADFKCDEIIIGGDFNLVLDVEKDKKGGLSRTHKKSLEVINSPGGGALGYFLGGYVSPGTPDWHPVLKKNSPKLDTPF